VRPPFLTSAVPLIINTGPQQFSSLVPQCKDDWGQWLKLAKQELDRLKVDVPARRAKAQASEPRGVPVQDEFLGRDVTASEFRIEGAEGEAVLETAMENGSA
jgi:hypothetical protein